MDSALLVTDTVITNVSPLVGRERSLIISSRQPMNLFTEHEITDCIIRLASKMIGPHHSGMVNQQD